MKHKLQTCLALVGLLATSGVAAPQSRVATFVENPALTERGSVLLFDDATGALFASPPELRDIRLLPLDFVGRTPLTESDPAAAQHCADVPRAARIALPEERGSLYHFERESDLGSTFGFFLLDRNGATKMLAERFVPREEGRRDPYFRRIALAPDGRAFLVATKRRGGGDLLEVEIGSGRVLNRTRHLEPLRFLPRGSALGEDWGIATTVSGVLRFSRDPRALAHEVSFPAPTPNSFSGDVVLSQNTDWALFTAGIPAHTYALNANSGVVRVSAQAARMSRAGFLPHFPNGPYMAISDDGQIAAWRQEMTDQAGLPTTELFLARVPAIQPAPAEQLTSDARYLDTLDEVGQIFFLDPTTLAYTVGERELGIDTLGFADADIFTARLPVGSGAPQILNLSRTNGQLGPPFTIAPELKPKRLAWLKEEQRFLLFDDGNGEALVTVDAMLGGMQVVLDDVKDVGLFQRTPTGILFDARRTNAAGGDWELMRLSGNPGATPTLVQSSPTDNEYGRAASRRDGQVSFVGTPGALERLSRVHVETGAFQVMPGSAQFGPAIGYARSGALAFSRTVGGATQFGLWKPGGAIVTLALPANATGFVLPAF